MNYKFSESYDEFVCVNEEKDFIENFLNGVKSYNIAKEQLVKIYEMERDMYKSKVEETSCVEEYMLLSNWFSRNKLLIELCEFERKNINNIYDGVIRSYNEKIKELNFNILNSCILILNNKENKVIFGKERDINLYVDCFNEMTGKGKKVLNKIKV